MFYAPPFRVPETDDELRRRLLYVTATVNQPGDRRVAAACGAELDAVAEEYGLRRR